MGFFFRIFLSHAFGEENVGLYQLVFPVYALCLALSTSGIQTAVSHMTAEKTALKKNTEARSILEQLLALHFLFPPQKYYLYRKMLLLSPCLFLATSGVQIC